MFTALSIQWIVVAKAFVHLAFRFSGPDGAPLFLWIFRGNRGRGREKLLFYVAIALATFKWFSRSFTNCILTHTPKSTRFNIPTYSSISHALKMLFIFQGFALHSALKILCICSLKSLVLLASLWHSLSFAKTVFDCMGTVRRVQRVQLHFSICWALIIITKSFSWITDRLVRIRKFCSPLFESIAKTLDCTPIKKQFSELWIIDNMVSRKMQSKLISKMIEN